MAKFALDYTTLYKLKRLVRDADQYERRDLIKRVVKCCAEASTSYGSIYWGVYTGEIPFDEDMYGDEKLADQAEVLDAFADELGKLVNDL